MDAQFWNIWLVILQLWNPPFPVEVFGVIRGASFKYGDGLPTPPERATMMAKDLKDKSKVDEIVLTIVEKKEPREWSSKWSGASGRVCDATGKDDNGDQVSISLWNDDIERVEVNTRIKISNGWVSSYKNKLQLSAGKFGKLEVLE